MIRALILFIIFVSFTSGCAKRSDQVSAAYVSPLQYASYDCNQLTEEATRLSSRVAQASGAQDDAADRDAVATGVGVVLFWPALFFLAAGDNEAELSRLKGEFEAVEREAVKKKCGIAEEIARARSEAAEKQRREHEERKSSLEKSNTD